MGQRDRMSRTKDRQGTRCPHDDTTSTVNAGIERVVCNACSRVSISYQSDTVRIFPSAAPPSPPEPGRIEPDLVIELPAAPAKKALRCSRCGLPAPYYTPEGLACSEHAWAAASDQGIDDDYFWIPLLLDR